MIAQHTEHESQAIDAQREQSAMRLLGENFFARIFYHPSTDGCSGEIIHNHSRVKRTELKSDSSQFRAAFAARIPAAPPKRDSGSHGNSPIGVRAALIQEAA